MKFTVVGHAALYVECDGTTLLVDPWFFGSCYWRSWWHYPPLGEVRDEWLRPDYVFLTHHHFDHFHYPTLRRLSRDSHVVVPKMAVDFMAGEFADLGFRRVTELAHGETMALSSSLDIAAYQYGFDDSALVITDGNTVIADLNDCKIRGKPLEAITKRFGRPTFLMKSHSWAQAYPICYTAEQPGDLELVSRETYLGDFLGTVREMQPTYAMPFASMVCLLHPETRHLNKSLVTPIDVAEAFARSGITTSQLVVCNPGDTWDSRDGFGIADVDNYTDRDVRLAQLEVEVAPLIQKSLVDEAARELRYEDFASYFGEFLRALPPLANRVVRRPVVFEVGRAEKEYWILDFRSRTVTRAPVAPPDRANLVRIAPGVLADAIEKKIVYFVHISMRIEVELRPNGHHEDFFFWGLLAIWELGYMPARRITNSRALGAVWRRRSEVWEAGVSKLFARGPLVDRVTSNLMGDDERAAGA
jgi:UDP-MurNAc hydroxylase